MKLEDGFYSITEDVWKVIKSSSTVKFHPGTLYENMDKTKTKFYAPISKNNKRPYIVENMTNKEFKSYVSQIQKG